MPSLSNCFQNLSLALWTASVRSSAAIDFSPKNDHSEKGCVLQQTVLYI